MPEIEIIRTDVITVDHCSTDQYGTLSVTDKAGKVHKINQKHQSLHSVFVPGIAVEIGYGSYLNKEFIHTAKQVKNTLPATKEIPPKSVPISNPQNRSYALSYAKDVAVARINKGEDVKAIAIIQVAELFRKWLDGDIDIEEK